MTRRWMLGGLAGALALAAAAATFGPGLLAGKGGGKAEDRGAPEKRAQLPIGRVVLFSSGVAYSQRQGTVEGAARVDLSFPAADVNDLLKSLVLRDLDGGAVEAVGYDSDAPLERTLRSFAVNLTGNPGFADLLNQARGERVEVAVQAPGAAATTVSGTVVGVERQRVAVGKDTVDVALLNLWCADGVRSLRLAEVQRVRFLNAALEGEFKKALEALAKSHDAQKRAVSIRFAGEGRRRVSVGYVVESPIWKTSYRLVLPTEKEAK